jgi:8-amino-7-oxononanoate synthase
LRKATVAALARGVLVGAGGTGLLRGNHAEHEALEAEAAAFFGAESPVFLARGFAANSALVATLPRRGGLVAHGALVHASVQRARALVRRSRRSVAKRHRRDQRCHRPLAGERRTSR